MGYKTANPKHLWVAYETVSQEYWTGSYSSVSPKLYTRRQDAARVVAQRSKYDTRDNKPTNWVVKEVFIAPIMETQTHGY